MTLILPRNYLSWSALSLWERNKTDFRKRYYENIELRSSAHSVYGREIHEMLEKNTALKHIPRYKHPEHPINVEIGGVMIYGFIDSFGATSRSFLDYKSGIRKEDGSPRWTQVEVEKLGQLPFYATLIKEKYGKVHPICKLVWLETRWKKKEDEKLVKIKLVSDKDSLELTGYHEVFKREIYPKEIEKTKEWIRTNAELISKDYVEWKKNI